MKAVISLGANIGDANANLDLAIGLLREATEVLAVSSYLQTKPIGGPEQPDYFNGSHSRNTLGATGN
jgi:2-amino-4-hydroxy-6-hydroxymethyldihydropteridine diphosphokinase